MFFLCINVGQHKIKLTDEFKDLSGFAVLLLLFIQQSGCTNFYFLYGSHITGYRLNQILYILSVG